MFGPPVPQAIIDRIKLAIKEQQVVLLAADDDVDGVTSIVEMDLGLGDSFGDVPIMVRDEFDKRISRDQVEDACPDLIILLDLRTERRWDDFCDIADTIIVDHHAPSGVLERALVYNPHLLGDDSYIPTSVLVGNILETMDMATDKTRFLAELGAFGDKANRRYVRDGEMVAELPFRYEHDGPDLFSEVSADETGSLPLLEGEVAAFAFARRLHTKGGEDSMNLLSYYGREKGLSEFCSTVTDLGDRQLVYDDLQRLDYMSSRLLAARPDTEKDRRFLLIPCPGRVRPSVIASHLASYHETTALVHVARKHDHIVSGRVAEGHPVDLVKLFGKWGGGHPAAASAKIRKLDFKVMVERLEDELVRMYSQ